MAPLTWRNVDRIGFGDSVAALRLSGDLLNRGVDMGDRALSEFDAWRTEQNDRTAMAAASRIQDPRAFRTALESGTAFGGVPATGLSTRALAALDTRAGALTERDAAAYANNRTQTTNAAEDAASPAIAALAAAARGGDPTAIAAAQRGLSLAGVPAGRVLEINRQLGLIEGTAVSTQGGRIQNEGGTIRNRAAEFGYNTTVRDDLDRQSGMGIAQRIAAASTTDADASQALAQLPESLSPGARAVIEGELRARGFNVNPNLGTGGVSVGGGGRTGAGGAIAGAANGRVPPSGYSPATSGDPPGTSAIVQAIPLTETRDYVQGITAAAARANGGSAPSGTIDQIVEAYLPHLVQQESNGQHTNPDGSLVTNRRSGAAGITQVVRRTGEDPGYGVRPLQNQSREEYLRFGRDYFRAMLQKHNGNVELALAAYNAGPGTVDTWLNSNADVRDAVAGRTTAQTLTAAQEAEQTLQVAQGQRRTANPLASRYLDLATRTEDDARTVARSLRGEGQPLAHLSEVRATEEIQRLIDRSPGRSMNAHQAAAILRESQQTHTSLLGAESFSIDRNRADALARSLTSREGAQASIVDQTITRTLGVLQQARTRVETLQAQLRQAEAALQNGQPVQTSVNNLRTQVSQARRDLQVAMAAASDIQPTYAPNPTRAISEIPSRTGRDAWMSRLRDREGSSAPFSAQ